MGGNGTNITQVKRTKYGRSKTNERTRDTI